LIVVSVLIVSLLFALCLISCTRTSYWQKEDIDEPVAPALQQDDKPRPDASSFDDTRDRYEDDQSDSGAAQVGSDDSDSAELSSGRGKHLLSHLRSSVLSPDDHAQRGGGETEMKSNKHYLEQNLSGRREEESSECQDETESESVARSQGERKSLQLLGKIWNKMNTDDHKRFPEIQYTTEVDEEDEDYEDCEIPEWDPENFNSDDIKDPDSQFEFAQIPGFALTEPVFSDPWKTGAV